MGSEQSSPEELDGDCYGYRILGMQENSPASTVGFVSFFDFIVACNGIRLDQRDNTFLELIANNEDRPLQLSVYNVKSNTTRELALTPSSNWAGKGLLGVTIRFDCFEGAEDEIIHVLNTQKKSPAEIAGFVGGEDYILGTPEKVFRDVDEFDDEILNNVGRPFQCYVYNVESDEVRLATLLPNDKWGGGVSTFVGAEFGFGYLHRLPERSRESVGTSVGFLSISKNVIAATDAYGKRNKEPKNNSALEDDNLEVEGNDGVSRALKTPSEVLQCNSNVHGKDTDLPATTHVDLTEASTPQANKDLSIDEGTADVTIVQE